VTRHCEDRNEPSGSINGCLKRYDIFKRDHASFVTKEFFVKNKEVSSVDNT
jgi:hypothetical protein